MQFETYFSQIIQWFDYSVTCATLPIKAQGCANFWVTCYLLAICICLALFLYATRNILRDKAAFKAYQKRKIARAQVADADIMEKLRWQPDGSFDEIEQSALAQKMRKQLSEKLVKK